MPEDCIFCQIVDGEIPSHAVAETDDAVAFLDANPLAEGHTLVVPRSHRETIDELTTAEAEGLFAAVGDLVPRVEAAVDADASNVGINNGEAAGQEVPHVHVHIVPRFDGDGGAPIHAVAGERPDLSDDELAGVAEAIRPD